MKIKRFKISKDYDRYRVIEEVKTIFGSKENKIDYFFTLEKAKEFIGTLEKGSGIVYESNWIEF